MDASFEFFLGTRQSFIKTYTKKSWENNSVDNTLAVSCEDPSSEPLEATYELVKCGGLPVIPNTLDLWGQLAIQTSQFGKSCVFMGVLTSVNKWAVTGEETCFNVWLPHTRMHTTHAKEWLYKECVAKSTCHAMLQTLCYPQPCFLSDSTWRGGSILINASSKTS